MSRDRFFLLVVLGGLLFLSSCNLPENEAIHCTEEELVAPNITSPAPDAIIGWEGHSLPPNLLHWEYPADCEPDAFYVLLATDPDFHHGRSGDSSGDETGWPDPDDEYRQMALEPATEYFWKVRARVGSTYGPFSEVSTFFTEPYCASESDIASPILMDPDDREELDTRDVVLHYQPPDGGCIPQGYFVDLQTDPSFGGESLVGEISSPTTYVTLNDLEDCTIYYWRVAQIYNGVQGPFSETHSFRMNTGEVLGCVPYSALPPTPSHLLPFCASAADLAIPEITAPASHEVVLFSSLDTSHTDFMRWQYEGSCSPTGYRLEIATNRRFQDSTFVESTVPSWPPSLPVGELEAGTEYWWRVAGLVGSDVGEYSQPSAFFIGPTCNSAQPDAPRLIYPEDNSRINNRSVELHYLPPNGQLCLPDGYFIDVQETPLFTEIPTYGEYDFPATTLFTEELEDCTTYYWRVAQIVGGVQSDFSETYSFFVDANSTCPPPIPHAYPEINLNCRSGPSKAYPEVSILMAEQFVPLLARNETGSWFLVANPTGGRGQCWISNYYLHIFGNINILPEEAAPPPPTETPIACSKNLNRAQCEAAGGKWSNSATTAPYCICP